MRLINKAKIYPSISGDYVKVFLYRDDELIKSMSSPNIVFAIGNYEVKITEGKKILDGIEAELAKVKESLKEDALANNLKIINLKIRLSELETGKQILENAEVLPHMTLEYSKNSLKINGEKFKKLASILMYKNIQLFIQKF